MDGYYAWMIVATALVLMMTVPALALFYGGMTRSKSVLNMMMMSFAAFAAVGLVFILWGWSEGWGGDGVGNGNGDLIANPFSMFGLHGVSPGNYIYVLFQLTFAAITAALITGAIADRVRMSAWIVFVVALGDAGATSRSPTTSGGGGWLAHSHFPNHDFAGGTVVHINAGAAGLALALISASGSAGRKEPMRPHNMPFDAARRRPAVVRLVRLQRRLRRCSAPTSVGRPVAWIDHDHRRDRGRDARLARRGADPLRQGHRARRRVRRGRRPGRDHPGVRLRSTPLGAIFIGVDRRRGLRLRGRPEVQARLRRLARRRRRALRRRHRRHAADRLLRHRRHAPLGIDGFFGGTNGLFYGGGWNLLWPPGAAAVRVLLRLDRRASSRSSAW